MTGTPGLTPTVEDVEKFARIQLPESAEEVQFFAETEGIDVFVAMKFVIPSNDLEKFLIDSGYEGPLQRIKYLSEIPGYALELDNNIPGWPSDAKWEAAIKEDSMILFGAKVSEPGFNRGILVDKTNSDTFVIYLVHNSL
ncbi:MAG: hypothetical protein GTO18_04675 [Anaerolineales bacterium]|nr:hypothetical protein [Anaerolineales bacterium]